MNILRGVCLGDASGPEAKGCPHEDPMCSELWASVASGDLPSPSGALP